MISLYKYYCFWQYYAKVQVDKISQAKVLARIRRADMCVCACFSLYKYVCMSNLCKTFHLSNLK